MLETSRVVYFDHNATTRPSAEVLEALRHSLDVYENPSSSHPGGKRARELIESGRAEVAKLVGCCPEEVVFTGSGTEAINTAILGVAWRFLGQPCHVITTAIEHAATLASCRRLEKLGMQVTYLPVGPDGIVAPESVRQALKPHTQLIAVMHANNEIGVLQPIEQIARIANEAGVPFFTDAVQTAGKIPLDFAALGGQLMAISGHKFHGPKGVGALIKSKDVLMAPLLTGGEQESGLRSGTENTTGILGMAAAAREAQRTMHQRARYVASLRERLCAGLLELGDVRVNGDLNRSLPGTLNVSFRHIKGDALMTALAFDGIAVSTGSACHAKEARPSHVLVALGLTSEWLFGGLRFSLDAANTVEEVDHVLKRVRVALTRFRAMSPLLRPSIPQRQAIAAING